MKKTFESIFMQLAIELAGRSTCNRRSVGCVVTADDYGRVYGIGYNGNYKGGPNHCDSEEPGKCGCLHAEDNALLKVSERPEVPKIAFITLAPCVMCAKRIINKGGIKKVFYLEEYRCTEGIKTLRSVGIEVKKMVPVGGSSGEFVYY